MSARKEVTMTNTDRLVAAMRRRFKTPSDAVRAMGLDVALLNEREDMATRDPRRSLRARQMAMDAAELNERERSFDEMLDDPETSGEEILARLIEEMPEEKRSGLIAGLGSLGEDMRGRHAGPHQWARDTLERHKMSRDFSRARRFRAADNEQYPGGPEPFKGEPLRGGGMYEGEDRRGRGAMDRGLAFDRSNSDRVRSHSGLFDMPRLGGRY
jgi:hypothetical protein